MQRTLTPLARLLLAAATLVACAPDGATESGDDDGTNAGAASETTTARDLMPSVARVRLVRTTTDVQGKAVGLVDDVTVRDAAEVARVVGAIRTFKGASVPCTLTTIPTTAVTFLDARGGELGMAILGCSMSVLSLAKEDPRQVAYTAATVDDAVLRGDPTSPVLSATRAVAIETWRALGGLDALDTNRDKRVTPSESAAVAKRQGRDPELTAKVLRVGLDRDGDGAVSAREASIAE